MMRTVVASLLMFVSVLAYSQGNLNVSPMRIDCTSPPGSNKVFPLKIANTSDKPVQLNVRLADWKRDSAGTITYSPAGSLDHSCSKWVQLLQDNNILLAPKETKLVNVMINVPALGADQLKNCMLFFTQLNPETVQVENGLSVKMVMELGVQIVYTPVTAKNKKIDILDFRDSIYTINENKKGGVRLSFANTGQMEANGKVIFEITDLDTGKLFSKEEYPVYTLPGEVRLAYHYFSPALFQGHYNIAAIVDIGSESELEIGEITFGYHP